MPDNSSLLQSFIQMMNDPNNNPASLQTAGGSKQGLNQFFSSPLYNLLYGQGNGSQQASAANAGTYDPVQAFHADPAFDYNMHEALTKVNQQSAAKGLLESGATQRDLLTTAQGLQNNQYNNYLQNTLGAFNTYQGQLQGLSQMGLNTTGANQANQLGQLLGTTFNQNALGTASQQSQGQLNTGDNISQLLANLGIYQGNASLNTGAAQANNYMNGLALALQLQNQGQATQAGTMNSGLQGQGAMAGAQQVNGGSSGGYSTYQGNPWQFF